MLRRKIGLYFVIGRSHRGVTVSWRIARTAAAASHLEASPVHPAAVYVRKYLRKTKVEFII